MATIIKTKSGTWRAEARVNKNGKRVFREIRHFDTKREAEDWGSETEARVKQTIATGRAMPTEITLSQAIEQWEADTQAFIDDAPPLLKKSKEFVGLVSRFEKGKSRRKHWAKDARLGDKALRDISQLDLEIHIDDRRDDEISDSTIYKDLDMLRQLYDHAAAATQACGPRGWQWQIDCPTRAAGKSRKLKSSGRRDRRLNVHEIDALHDFFEATRAAYLAAPKENGKKHWIEVKTADSKTVTFLAHDSLLYIAAAFETSLECALRRGKLFEMTWRWVDLTPGAEYIVIPPEHLGPDNKGAPGYLPMTPDLVECLKELHEGTPKIGKALDEPVFGTLLPDRAYRLLKIACEALGIVDFRWHDLRHEACSRLAERGWTIMQIQSVSGHKSLQSLQRYIKINKREIYEKMREDTKKYPSRRMRKRLEAISMQPNAINEEVELMEVA